MWKELWALTRPPQGLPYSWFLHCLILLYVGQQYGPKALVKCLDLGESATKLEKISVPVASTDARAHRCANPHWIPSTPWDSEHYQGWPLSSHIIAEWVLLQYSGYPHIKLLVQSARNGHEQPFVHLFKLSQGTSTSAPKNRENTQQPAPGMGC